MRKWVLVAVLVLGGGWLIATGPDRRAKREAAREEHITRLLASRDSIRAITDSIDSEHAERAMKQDSVDVMVEAGTISVAHVLALWPNMERDHARQFVDNHLRWAAMERCPEMESRIREIEWELIDARERWSNALEVHGVGSPQYFDAQRMELGIEQEADSLNALYRRACRR